MSPAAPPGPPADATLPALRWFELFLVLFVAFAHSLLTSTYIVLFGVPNANSSYGNIRYLSSSVQQIGALLLLWYVLKRSGRTLSTLGFRASLRGFWQGCGLGIACMMIYYVTAFVLQVGHRLWFGNYAVVPKYTSMFPVASVAVLLFFSLLNPLFEEVIVRGYLMTELAETTGSMVLAVGTSVVLQTSYHLYQGWLPATCLFFQFLILSIYYLRTRRLFSIVIAHAAIDLVFAVRLLSFRPR